MTLAGKTALVTGGSRGIGRGVVWELARQGAQVAFVYRSNTEAADQLVKDLELDQRTVMAIQADVADVESADRVVESVLEAWENIDILVNNAGIIRDGLLATMDHDQWQAVIDTNLGGGRVARISGSDPVAVLVQALNDRLADSTGPPGDHGHSRHIAFPYVPWPS